MILLNLWYEYNEMVMNMLEIACVNANKIFQHS